MSAPQLRLEFCGEEYSADPGSTLTFGRNADVIIDDNRFLHRVLGEFHHANGLWWLRNVGSAIAVSLSDEASASMSRVAPGTSTPIVFAASTLRFDAGGSAYEMTIDLVGNEAPDDDDVDEDDSSSEVADDGDSAEMTTTTTSLPLTDDQFKLLVTLATPLLNNEDSLPTNRQLASGLGWTVTKYNRKLDGLCAKFTKAGVAGLHGSADRLAKDRRTRLAEHVVHAGIIRSKHLE